MAPIVPAACGPRQPTTRAAHRVLFLRRIKVVSEKSAPLAWSRWHEAASVRPRLLESRPAREPSPTTQVSSFAQPLRNPSGENSPMKVQNVVTDSTDRVFTRHTSKSQVQNVTVGSDASNRKSIIDNEYGINGRDKLSFSDPQPPSPNKGQSLLGFGLNSVHPHITLSGWRFRVRHRCVSAAITSGSSSRLPVGATVVPLYLVDCAPTACVAAMVGEWKPRCESA